MRIVIDGQKLSVNPRTTRDALLLLKSMARTLGWRTSYDPSQEVIYIATAAASYESAERDGAAHELAALESDRLQDKVVCIDPGHGGEDPGAIGPGGTREADNALAIAMLLREKLETNGASVVMTRCAEDEPLTAASAEELRRRAALVQDSGADLLVSIHNDAFTSSSACGSTTFHYGDDASVRLAACVQSALVEELGTKDRGARFASFYLLRQAEMPAVLVEAAFISNPEEELLLASSDGRAKIAASIYQGIARYFRV